MEQLKTIGTLEDYANLLETALVKKDFTTLSKLSETLKAAENLFLNNYTKRKKEGVYYTDFKISSFLVSEALMLWLKKKLKNQLNLPPELTDLKNLFDLSPSLKKQVVLTILSATICDPACGSGVFLLSYADLVKNMIMKLDPALSENEVKKLVLKNIYGFEINPIAINLCTLKLFEWFNIKDPELNEYFFATIRKNLKIFNSLQNKIEGDQLFDLIVGNPPYGNILDKNEKASLKEENIFYNDIYCAFIIKAIKWNKGIVGFLVPKSFLLRHSYLEFRNQLLKEANVLKIFDLGPNLFKSATNEVQILLYERKLNGNDSLKVYNYPNELVTVYNNQEVDNLKTCPNPYCSLRDNAKKFLVYTFEEKCPFCEAETIPLNRIRIKCTSEIYLIIESIEKNGDLNYLSVKDFPNMVRGEEEKSLSEIRMLLKKGTGESCIYISAKDDLKYYYINKKKSFNLEAISVDKLKKNTYDYYIKPKLLIKHNNTFPEATFTKEKICFSSSIYSLIQEDLNELKYLCAILNSAVVQFYCIFGINNQRGTTINLNQYMIRHIPIVRANQNTKLKISSLVDLIEENLENSKGEINKEEIRILKEINLLIFDLYNISESQRISIVNNLKSKIYLFKEMYSE